MKLFSCQNSCSHSSVASLHVQGALSPALCLFKSPGAIFILLPTSRLVGWGRSRYRAPGPRTQTVGGPGHLCGKSQTVGHLRGGRALRTFWKSDGIPRLPRLLVLEQLLSCKQAGRWVLTTSSREEALSRCAC